MMKMNRTTVKSTAPPLMFSRITLIKGTTVTIGDLSLTFSILSFPLVPGETSVHQCLEEVILTRSSYCSDIASIGKSGFALESTTFMTSERISPFHFGRLYLRRLLRRENGRFSSQLLRLHTFISTLQRKSKTPIFRDQGRTP